MMAHECPICCSRCHCGGDIDDILFESLKYEALCEHCPDTDEHEDACEVCFGYGEHGDEPHVCGHCDGTGVQP